MLYIKSSIRLPCITCEFQSQTSFFITSRYSINIKWLVFTFHLNLKLVQVFLFFHKDYQNVPVKQVLFYVFVSIFSQTFLHVKIVIKIYNIPPKIGMGVSEFLVSVWKIGTLFKFKRLGNNIHHSWKIFGLTVFQLHINLL